MKITRLVHKREPHDVYIGRPSIWGNPWSHKPGTKAKFKVATRKEAVAAYENWLRNDPYPNYLDSAAKKLMFLLRSQILTNLHTLEGKTLACWCAPALCHGEVLIQLLREQCDNSISER